MAERRSLTFATLDRVMPDVDRLLEGHVTLGKWSLAQICNHLCTAVTYTVEGYPGRAPWIVRATIGAFARRRLLKTGRMASGIRLPAEFQPKPGLDARAEAEALRASLQYYAGHQGTPVIHPILGKMNRAEWDRFHAVHCAHHLSFVLPTSSEAGLDATA